MTEERIRDAMDDDCCGSYGRYWWLAPTTLAIGALVATTGLVFALVGGIMQMNSSGSASSVRLIAGFTLMALPTVFAGLAIVLASGVLYRRCGSCCGDCDWEEDDEPAVNVTVKGKPGRKK